MCKAFFDQMAIILDRDGALKLRRHLDDLRDHRACWQYYGIHLAGMLDVRLPRALFLCFFFSDGRFTLGDKFKCFLMVAHIRVVGNDGHKAV